MGAGEGLKNKLLALVQVCAQREGEEAAGLLVVCGTGKRGSDGLPKGRSMVLGVDHQGPRAQGILLPHCFKGK